MIKRTYVVWFYETLPGNESNGIALKTTERPKNYDPEVYEYMKLQVDNRDIPPRVPGKENPAFFAFCDRWETGSPDGHLMYSTYFNWSGRHFFQGVVLRENDIEAFHPNANTIIGRKHQKGKMARYVLTNTVHTLFLGDKLVECRTLKAQNADEMMLEFHRQYCHCRGSLTCVIQSREAMEENRR